MGKGPVCLIDTFERLDATLHRTPIERMPLNSSLRDTRISHDVQCKYLSLFKEATISYPQHNKSPSSQPTIDIEARHDHYSELR